MISKATLDDAKALNVLVNSAYRGEISRKGWTTEADFLDGTRIDESALRDLISRPDTIVLKYEENDVLLGCVELRQEGEKLYLGMLSVNPEYQSGGIGKKLLFAAEDVAHRLNCKAIKMNVIDGRKELIEWYTRHGYTLTGERKPFVVPDERWGIPKKQLEFVLMEKPLI